MGEERGKKREEMCVRGERRKLMCVSEDTIAHRQPRQRWPQHRNLLKAE